MSQQPEALRLADELESMQPAYFTREVAAELRRLHGLADKYKWQVRDTCARAEKAEAQRDELLAALNAMLTHMGMDEDDWNKPTFDQARDAIAKATGTKNRLETLAIAKVESANP